MSLNSDKPIKLYKSLDELLDTFRIVMTSMTWLKVSIDCCDTFYKKYPYIIDLTCSITNKSIKVHKSIIDSIKSEGVNRATPLYSKSLLNFYRVFIIAAKDIVWEDDNFKPFLKNPELQFLYHFRNASAHNNKFFFGLSGKQRKNTVSKLPISWRGKIIEEKTEDTKLLFDFISPGDLFILLSDISELVK